MGNPLVHKSLCPNSCNARLRNKTLLTTVVAIFITLSGCDYGKRLSLLEKQNEELNVQIKKEQATADYDSQAKCSKDAKLWFNENWPRDKQTILLTYTNHYSKWQNKCFIVVEYHYRTDSKG
jgi:hypothetical protein